MPICVVKILHSQRCNAQVLRVRSSASLMDVERK